MQRLRVPLALAIISTLLFYSFVSAESVYQLPTDMDFPCYEPNPACFTESGYQDESLSVQCEHRTINGVIYDIIWMHLKHPSQLRTLTAGAPNEPAIEYASAMSRYVNAIAAINGEYYLQRDRDIFVWRQGIVYRNEPDPKKDILIIDSKGDFHVFTSENKREELDCYLAEGGDIVNAFSFGPALVAHGKALKIRDDYYFNCHERLPRTVIAQINPLDYVFVVAEGKKKDSKGCTHQEMANFMASLGVETAYNLDGGQSTVMMFHGRYYMDYYKELEREQSDIVFVTTAVDPKTWK